MPATPRACRPSLTASSWCGLMTAVTSFMSNPSITGTLAGNLLGWLPLGRSRGGRVCSGVRTTAQTREGKSRATAGRCQFVSALRVLRDVDAVDLGLGRRPEADGVVDHPADDEGEGERKDR